MRALSEVLASVLLISITLSAFFVAWPLLSNYVSSQAQGASSQAAQEEQGSQVLLSLVYWKVKGNSTVLYVYNYGTWPFVAQEGLVDGKLVEANGTVQPGQLAAVTVSAVGSSVVLMGKGGVVYDFPL